MAFVKARIIMVGIITKPSAIGVESQIPSSPILGDRIISAGIKKINCLDTLIIIALTGCLMDWK